VAVRKDYAAPTGLENFVGGSATKILLLTELGCNRVAVGNYLRTMTQGSACRATLGFGTESRWDSQKSSKLHIEKIRILHKFDPLFSE